LIELLLVVAILGLLAAIVIPKFATAGADSSDASLRRHLQIIRHQIEFYRAQTRSDPQLIANQWGDLVLGGYLHNPPVNPLNTSPLVAGAPGPNVGWIWRDQGNGTMELYATDATGMAEYIE
jgi:type II secretory pathway pseudopilin PulG